MKKRKGQIESQARRLRKQIWEERLATQGAEVPQDLYELVEPELAAEVLRFDHVAEESLGQFGERGNRFEVAGAYDRERTAIQVSTRFPPEEVRFTGAHEIGHVVLHLQHRPLPVATSFSGEHFDWLFKRFRVSTTAMALRLIETGLVPP